MYKENYSFDDLVEIINMLRGENGCEWDKAQTHDSLLRYLVEESYEFIEAAREKNPAKMADELGDVLLQVMLHSRIGEEENTFSIDDVINAVCRKMVYRHPHVFSDVKADNVEEILANWEELKQKEKGMKTTKEVFGEVSKGLPALLRAQKILEKGKKNPVISEIREEAKEKFSAAETAEEKYKAAGKAMLEAISFAASEGINIELCLNDCIDGIIERCE